MARRVIQFPVRNAFAAQRSRDSLARDAQQHSSQNQAHRIAEQVENEIARLAERHSTGSLSELDIARNRGVLLLRPTSRAAHVRKRITALPSRLRNIAAKLFTRRK